MILQGKAIAKSIHARLGEQVHAFQRAPGLAVLLVGDDPSSQTYINMKRRACEQVGITSTFHPLPASTTEEELLHLIDGLNRDPQIDGILVQLPLPRHIDPIQVVQAVAPEKDVDGFHPTNLGKLVAGLSDGFVPCTPLGIHTLLQASQLSVEGKRVVIVGRSAIVGKPLAALWMQDAPGCNATVTVAHSRTPHLGQLTSQADVVVAAVGRPRLITAEMVREGAIVIDVGITRVEGKLVGDVDFEPVERKCHAITPVPGGVGPMTVAMLLHNTVLSYQRAHS